ncbi:MAG: aspartate/glutamate racemase family protein [Desulfovibrio sp.]|nr:aspartate/glutamate racemase family protein [Desulfovibrio sp.]
MTLYGKKMKKIAHGGRTVYGFDIGILMLDTKFPRIPGDVGNALTWNFPVLYKIVQNAFPEKIVRNPSESDIEPFVQGALELQNAGVRAITTSCGFLAMFQDVLAARLDIPVFTSSLLQLPFMLKIFPNKKVLILTVDSNSLTTRHIQAACGNVDEARYEIVGTENRKYFTKFFVGNTEEADIEACQNELLDVLEVKLSRGRHDFGGILLECTNMPPYSDAIRKKFHLPVYDFVTLTNFVHSTYCANGFSQK